MTPAVALTIAGSDSGGGAGVQADLKTFAARGVFGASAITAITAQNTAEVRCVHVLPVEVVRAQLDAVLDDLPVAAVKTGMLATAEMIELVADFADAGRLPNLVVDPVMVASSGARLLDEAATRSYLERLLPRATVFTPNRLEAETLLQRPLLTLSELYDAASELAAMTPGVVVVKGGHATGDTSDTAVDVIATAHHHETIAEPRIDTIHTHGSGCSLASAIAAELARGAEPVSAIRLAKAFVHRAIAGAADWHLGAGHGPLDHFHWEDKG